MTLTLLVLSVSIVGLLATATSGAVGFALPWLNKFGHTLPPRQEVYFWLGVSMLPLIVGSLLLAVAMLPAFNVGTDHCFLHEGHPHLCWRHSAGQPGVLLLVICGFFGFKCLSSCISAWRGVLLGARTSNSLTQASRAKEDFLVFESPDPQAFVLGAWRPQLHVSSAMLALAPEVVEPVLAHERAHARHYDFLWRAIFPLLALGHFRGVGKEICTRLVTAQEKSADAAAAEALHNPLLVAEAIISLSSSTSAPQLGLGFTHGDTVVRVQALLGLTPPAKKWPRNLSLASALFALLFVVRSHTSVHHILEHLLGFLS